MLRKKREPPETQPQPPPKVAELAERLAGVEALLSQMVAREDKEAMGSSADSDNMDDLDDSDESPDVEERYAGCSFWKGLCEQVGLVYMLLSMSFKQS